MIRWTASGLLACATLVVAAMGVAEEAKSPAARLPPVSSRPPPGFAPKLSAETILANQPVDLVARLMEENVIVLQEITEEGAHRGAIVSSYVIFEKPVERVYMMLAQSARQIEYRPELQSIETIEWGPDGPIDEQRLKILFRRYVYRLKYHLAPEERRIEWVLDERFDNDFARVFGYWELYEMTSGRTLGRSGTSIDAGPSIPTFLQDWVTRKNIPRAMKRVRRWVNSDGTYRP